MELTRLKIITTLIKHIILPFLKLIPIDIFLHVIIIQINK